MEILITFVILLASILPNAIGNNKFCGTLQRPTISFLRLTEAPFKWICSINSKPCTAVLLKHSRRGVVVVTSYSCFSMSPSGDASLTCPGLGISHALDSKAWEVHPFQQHGHALYGIYLRDFAHGEGFSLLYESPEIPLLQQVNVAGFQGFDPSEITEISSKRLFYHLNQFQIESDYEWGDCFLLGSAIYDPQRPSFLQGIVQNANLNHLGCQNRNQAFDYGKCSTLGTFLDNRTIEFTHDGFNWRTPAPPTCGNCTTFDESNTNTTQCYSGIPGDDHCSAVRKDGKCTVNQVLCTQKFFPSQKSCEFWTSESECMRHKDTYDNGGEPCVWCCSQKCFKNMPEKANSMCISKTSRAFPKFIGISKDALGHDNCPDLKLPYCTGYQENTCSLTGALCFNDTDKTCVEYEFKPDHPSMEGCDSGYTACKTP